MRHAAASLMIASGADVKAVQNALGHSDATVSVEHLREPLGYGG